ncbi:hypothetical protein [uncultured Victivallis sp.]|uniref:hypothetical protein n=1 Tax=uncultured Victivallis sp. TaxID=354118 RepID=UPI00259238AD|nr:hypothetical protein [uncultured Victivallis sp.]
MSKTFLIAEKIYGIPLRVFIGSYQEYSDFCYRIYGLPQEPQINFGGESFIVTLKNKGKAEVFIWLPSFSVDSANDLAVLSHECAHITLKVLFQVGITVSKDNEEPFCYLMEYFFHSALTRLMKKTGENPRSLQDSQIICSS